MPKREMSGWRKWQKRSVKACFLSQSVPRADMSTGQTHATEAAEAIAGFEIIAVRSRRGTQVCPALFSHSAAEETAGMIDY
jgi:hypothetical protein